MGQKMTMAELAKEIGCSRSQVSRALNGRPNVAPEIRAKVLAAAERSNYRNSSNRHRIRIACISDHFSGYFIPQIFEHIQLEAASLGWECNVLGDIANDEFYDGVISAVYKEKWAREWGATRNLPLVMLNSYASNSDYICSVEPDPFDEAELVLRHLKELGHRKIARMHMVTQAETAHRGRFEFLQAAQQLQLPWAENIELTNDLEWPAAFRDVLGRGFTAAYVIHQHQAARAASVLQKLGVRIPEDFSLITYELPEISEYLTPPHTTVNFDFAALSKRALHELRLRMLDKAGSLGAIRLPNCLIVRSSTGIVRQG